MLGLASASSLAAEPAMAVRPAAIQEAASTSKQNDLASYSDEFGGRSLSPTWRRFDEAYGWPSKIKSLDVGKSTPGALNLQPYDSAWVRELHAPFLYQKISGDFDVRTRVRVRSQESAVPTSVWSLGGLMVRLPNANTATAWEPRRENWFFLTTGVGHLPGKVMTETKATINSVSNLKLRPFAAGWVELRLVRVGGTIIALARQEGGRWEVRDRFTRMDMPEVLEVGLTAYTASPDEPPGPDNAELENRRVKPQLRTDFAMDVDWIRFARPAIAGPAGLSRLDAWYHEVSGANPLSDPNANEEDILSLVGE
jgi:hypothetical protein